MKRLNQQGFSHAFLVVMLLIIVVVAVVAYKTVMGGPTTEQNTAASLVPSSIKTTDDLNKASKALDATDESALDSNQFNDDLNALL
jgi:hypothetical protein